MAAVLLPGSVPVGPPAPAPARLVHAGASRLELHVSSLGLACCAVEVAAAALRLPVEDGGTGGALDAPDAPGVDAHVLIVAGTVTDALVPAVLAAYARLPEPRLVLSYGACADCGGPYWDSYCVLKGVDQVLPVDVYVPGCPPRPEALLHGLAVLQQRLDAGP